MGELGQSGVAAGPERPRVTVDGGRKPCPKCGGERTVRSRSPVERDLVRCIDCDTFYVGRTGKVVSGASARWGWLIGLLMFFAAMALTRLLLMHR